MKRKIKTNDSAISNLEKSEIKLDNAIVEGKYDLSLMELRIVLLSISMLDKNYKESLRIPVRLIFDYAGITKENHSIIKAALKSIASKPIEIQKRETNEVLICNFFSMAKYQIGKGYIELSFHKDLIPYLIEIKQNFTILSLNKLFRLKSKYSIRIYQLLKRFEDTGFRVDDVSELKRKLGLKENELKKFSDFERKVIETAVNEINLKTDISVSYSKIKEGRVVKRIVFNIQTSKIDENVDRELPNIIIKQIAQQLNKEEADFITFTFLDTIEYDKKNGVFALKNLSKELRNFFLYNLEQEFLDIAKDILKREVSIKY